MPLQFKEIAPHVINVDERVLFVNIMLSDVYIEVVVAVLVEA